MDEIEQQRAYAEFVLAQDEVQGEMARQEAEDMELMAKSVQQYNREKAEESKLRRMIQLQDEKKGAVAMIAQAQQSSFLSEDTSVAQSALSSRRYRPDHFKGFDRDIVENIYRENDKVISERRNREVEEQQYEDEWANHQANVIAKMEEAELQRQAQGQQDDLNHAIFLQIQRKELKEKQHLMNKGRFGEIGEGSFFSKFGTSLT